jgi:FHS family L-fucose permease-like MFS transporter
LPSASLMSFPLFLFALFVGGIGNTLLQAAVNPYVTIIGPMESATMRMCLMGIMNKSAWWLGSLFLGLFMSVANAQMKDVPFPAMLAAGVLALFAIALIFVKLPEVKAVGEEESSDPTEVFASSGKTSIFQFPHLLLGAIALFLYVGIETLPIASMIGYVKSIFGADVASPEKYVVYITIGLVLGYLFGVAMIPKVISQVAALKLFTALAIVSSLILIFLPGSLSQYGIYCLASLGTFHSVMWGSIWALAIDGLGKFTKTGSSVLVMGIVGGAAIPLTFGFILDSLKGESAIATVAQYQNAYWIFVPAYLYILYFAYAGHKIRK